MIPLLFEKLNRQKQYPDEAEEAFMTAWRLVHRLLRKFYITKLCCDEEVIARLMARQQNCEGDSSFLASIKSTLRSNGMTDSVRQVLEKQTIEVNEASESDLFKKLSIRFTGLDISDFIKAQNSKIWADYESAARNARHYNAHGKVLVARADSHVKYSDLIPSLERILEYIESLFSKDQYYQSAREGRPVPPIPIITYDPLTRSITVDCHPALHHPNYGGMEG